MNRDTQVHYHPDAADMMTRLRRGMTWAGVVMIILGMAALIMPTISSLVVEVLLGWLLLVSGAVSVIGAMSLRGTGLFVAELVVGLCIGAAGLLLLLFPLEGLIALTVLIALVFLLTGAAQMSFALWVRPTVGWVWVALSAFISVVLGATILFALPEASVVLIGVLVGIDFVSTGVALVMLARSAP